MEEVRNIIHLVYENDEIYSILTEVQKLYIYTLIEDMTLYAILNKVTISTDDLIYITNIRQSVMFNAVKQRIRAHIIYCKNL